MRKRKASKKQIREAVGQAFGAMILRDPLLSAPLPLMGCPKDAKKSKTWMKKNWKRVFVLTDRI